VDTARKVDPEDEKKLVEFIRSECLRGQDPKSIRQKLVQAGWAEGDVVRLIGVATEKPDFRVAVKPVDLEAILVFQKDGNLRMQRELIDRQLRKKRVEDPFLPPMKPKEVVVEKRKLSVEEKARFVRIVAQGALIALLAYHFWLIGQKFMI
jgi:hypothetical protein